IAGNLPLNPSDLKGRGIAFGPSAFPCSIKNNIVTENPNDGIHLYQVPDHVISCNDVWGNAYLFGTQYDGCSPGEDDISEDPMYLDPAGDDYHLTWLSPCINRGNDQDAPDEDFDGDARPQAGTTDMGADEFDGLHSLAADLYTISCAAGGSIRFDINGSAGNAGRNCLLLGSATGTTPGIALPGGFATLPVTWDPFTDVVLLLVNSVLFTDFLGALDPSGSAAAQLNAPPLDPAYAGMTLYFAFCLNSPFDFVSNPVAVKLIP
ncbi:MAG: choice-of-anchor Q domain-containing protein, partial [Planctomycetota bacterium]